MTAGPNAGRGRRVEAPELPLDLLRRAADRVERLATDAGPGWDVYPEGGIGSATFDWIALLNPAIGAPLAAWLRGAADYADAVGCSVHSDALATARAILGEEP